MSQLTILTIIRAWRDDAYRLSLTDEQRVLVPEHPAGLIELDDTDLEIVTGGDDPVFVEMDAFGTGTGTGSGAGCSCWCQC